MSFLTLLQSQSATQTITLNTVESTAQIFLPTIVAVSSVVDTSDILSRNLKRQRQEEENIAAQLLKARQSKQTRAEKKKLVIDWKKLITDAINGVSSVEQLDNLQISLTGITSPAVTKIVLSEIQKQKELKRLELQIKEKELELQQIQINAQIQEAEAKIVEALNIQRAQLEEAKKLQSELLRRYQLAEDIAQKAANESFLQAKQAEEQYLAFKQKRDNRLKRLRALMWLAKLDL